MESLLEVKRLKKKINGRLLFENLSFKLDKGKSITIEGPSGSGKTTLLKCISLIDRVDAGEIKFDGEIISSKEFKKATYDLNGKIGFVFQEDNLWPHITARENISLPINLSNRSVDHQLLNKLYIKFNVDNIIDKYPSQLSGGEKQRVAIIRSIIHKPQLLLLDEFTSNLDYQNASEIYKYIENLLKEGISVITVSHNVELLPDFLKNRIVQIKKLTHNA